MRFTALLVIAFACSGASASDPGQPLDCSDWVFYEPGLSCTDWSPYPAATDPRTYIDEVAAFDMAQRMIRVRSSMVSAPAGCLYTWDMPQLDIVWSDGTNEGVIASVPPRCNGGTFEWVDAEPILEFDPVSGTLLVAAAGVQGCWPFDQQCSSDWPWGWWVAAIHGFTTTSQVQDTYTPLPQRPSIDTRRITP